MMPENKKLTQVIFDAIDEINEQIPEKQRKLTKSVDTVLLGESGKLDSLELVTLIIAIEQKLEDLFEVSITLSDEKAMSQKNSPFTTIGALTEYISKLMEQKIP